MAFVSDAPGLVADDDVPPGVPAVYLRDLTAGTTTLVSRANGTAGAAADGPSVAPSISGDGRLVAFASTAGNLAAGVPAGTLEVYVRDLTAGTTTLVSRAGPGGPAADGASSAPAISADGGTVAFVSTAANLASGVPVGSAEIYEQTLATGAITLVSRADGASGAPASLGASSPALSADGHVVAFSSPAPNLGGSSADAPLTRQVYARDVAAGTTSLISGAPGGSVGGTGASDGPSVSSDGQLVAFSSATRFVGALQPGVYVRDRSNGSLTLVSRGSGFAGPPANRVASAVSLSGDGRVAAFVSRADNLVRAELTSSLQVFAREWQNPLPVSIAAPAVTPDEPTVGDRLTCSRGTWTNGPTSFSFGWRRDGEAIDGATSDSYVTTDDDAESDLDCQVSARNAFGTGSAVSNTVTVSSASDASERRAPAPALRVRQLALRLAPQRLIVLNVWLGRAGQASLVVLQHGRVVGHTPPRRLAAGPQVLGWTWQTGRGPAGAAPGSGRMVVVLRTPGARVARVSLPLLLESRVRR